MKFEDREPKRMKEKFERGVNRFKKIFFNIFSPWFTVRNFKLPLE